MIDWYKRQNEGFRYFLDFALCFFCILALACFGLPILCWATAKWWHYWGMIKN